MKNVIDNIQKAIDRVDWAKTCHDNGKPTIIKEFSKDNDGYYSVCISAGMNGRGIWSNYFESLAKLMFQVELFYPDAFLLDINNDAADDIFYFYLGIAKYN
jgi:hypothetical protein